MLTTYKAVLRGNQLEWLDDTPEQLANQAEVPVHITILEEAEAWLTQTRGERMAEALEQLANSANHSAIDDPVAWQESVRAERTLPGRDNDVTR